MRTLAVVVLFLTSTPAALFGQQPAKPATPPTQAPAAASPAAKPAALPASPAAKPAPAQTAPAQTQKPAAPPAQAAPAPKPAQGTPAPAPPPAAPPPPAADLYSYQTEGRRDPFLSLLGTGGETHVVSKKGEGPAGMTVSEVTVRGIVLSRGSLIAMITGPDNKTYLVHQGDKFADGTIKNITPQGLIILQEVNDPLSLVKQREIRKLLRSIEDAK